MMAVRLGFRLSSPGHFNKSSAILSPMPALRACLLSTVLAGLAMAQPLPSSGLPGGLSRSGDVVMMQPIADGTSDGAIPGARPSRLHYLTPPEHDLFARAFAAADKGDWQGARALAAQGQNRTARRLLEWRYAMDRNSGATFADIDAVIRSTDAKGAAQWPLRGTLQTRAESAMDPNMAPADVVAWFSSRPPVSAIGRIRLGEALVATGERARGGALIARGWTDGSFDTATEQAILAKDSAFLTPASDLARLDALLWRGETSAARRQMARVDAATARIAEARIALTAGLPKAQAALDKVSDSNDPSLLFDWSRALRQADRDAEAHAMLLRVPAAPMVAAHGTRWWNECAIQARDALTAGDPRLALRLVEHAGFTSGDSYPEQQFLAGFIALRFLKDAAAAQAHFQKLDAGVARPISKSRAQYWLGRSLEDQGDRTAALTHYRQAAAYPETFYGQMALARTASAPLLHLTDTIVEAAPPSEIEADALIGEIKVLADLGQASTLRAFIDRDAESYAAPAHIKRLILLLNDWGYPEIAVRLAKGLSYTGAAMPAYTHPVIALPPYAGPGTAPEAPLVLGLIRQETEFNPYAVSGAGARGLMQMMPASAKIAAKANNQPYRPDALLTDTVYNIQLGMTEWRGHLDRYDGSWVLAIASYNAGPNNVRRWITANGDPRTGDPIDWIEQIPFGETRNYVQRVLENTEVYRARLAGKDVPLRILDDLYAPSSPPAETMGSKAP